MERKRRSFWIRLLLLAAGILFFAAAAVAQTPRGELESVPPPDTEMPSVTAAPPPAEPIPESAETRIREREVLPPPPVKPTGWPWWVWFLLFLVLLALVVGVAMLLRRRRESEEEREETTTRIYEGREREVVTPEPVAAARPSYTRADYEPARPPRPREPARERANETIRVSEREPISRPVVRERVDETIRVSEREPATGQVVTEPGLPLVTRVRVKPCEATVESEGTYQFEADVVAISGKDVRGVTWTATAGTIDETGLFKAPGVTDGPLEVGITATSVANPSKQGTATVTVTPASSPSSPIRTYQALAVAAVLFCFLRPAMAQPILSPDITVNPSMGVPGEPYDVTISGSIGNAVNAGFWGLSTAGQSVWVPFRVARRGPYSITGTLDIPDSIKPFSVLGMRLVMANGQRRDFSEVFAIGTPKEIGTANITRVGLRNLFAATSAREGREPSRTTAFPRTTVTIEPTPPAVSPRRQAPRPAGQVTTRIVVTDERIRSAVAADLNAMRKELATLRADVNVLRSNDDLLQKEVGENRRAIGATRTTTTMALRASELALKVSDVAIRAYQAEHDKKTAKKMGNPLVNKKVRRYTVAEAIRLLDEARAPAPATAPVSPDR